MMSCAFRIGDCAMFAKDAANAIAVYKHNGILANCAYAGPVIMLSSKSKEH